MAGGGGVEGADGGGRGGGISAGGWAGGSVRWIATEKEWPEAGMQTGFGGDTRALGPATTSGKQQTKRTREDRQSAPAETRRDEQSQVANRADRVSRRVDRPRLPSPVALVSPPRFAAPVPCPGSPLPVSGAPAKLRKANYTPPHPTFPRLTHSCAVSRTASSTSDLSGPRPPRPARCRRTWCDSGLDVCAPPAPGLGLRSIRPHRQSIGGGAGVYVSAYGMSPEASPSTVRGPDHEHGDHLVSDPEGAHPAAAETTASALVTGPHPHTGLCAYGASRAATSLFCGGEEKDAFPVLNIRAGLHAPSRSFGAFWYGRGRVGARGYVTGRKEKRGRWMHV